MSEAESKIDTLPPAAKEEPQDNKTEELDQFALAEKEAWTHYHHRTLQAHHILRSQSDITHNLRRMRDGLHDMDLEVKTMKREMERLARKRMRARYTPIDICANYSEYSLADFRQKYKPTWQK